MAEGIAAQSCVPRAMYFIRETGDVDDMGKTQTKDSEYLRKLAASIEREREKLSSVPLDSLSSHGTILRLNKLEKLINEYINLGINKLR